MHVDLIESSPSQVSADWLLTFAWEDDPFEFPDPHFRELVAKLSSRGDISGKAHELTPLYAGHGLAAERLMIVGLGKKAKADRGSLVESAATAARSITSKQVQRIAYFPPSKPDHLSWKDVFLGLTLGVMQGSTGPGIRKKEPARFEPHELACCLLPATAVDEVRAFLREAEVVGNCVRLARELVNLPPSELYPESFATRAAEHFHDRDVAVQILDEKALESERMGALLAVARGSDRPPRLVALRHRHSTSGRTLALVGKGVTFDSGGLSLKSTEHMVDMKCDMAGAAAVFGAVSAIADLKIPVNVVGVMALVENMPSGRAMKLGDVLHTRGGKTIEVLNTDAEGRLILADALSYAVDQDASHLVDLATLTGACMIALGTDVAGAMSNNDGWCERVLTAAARAGEKVWRLPMFPHYDALIKSEVADMKNTGGTRYGGAITAAKLLEQFVGETPWVHLDIAGPAWKEHESPALDAGGTGCFVRTLVELAHAYGEN